MPLLETKSPEEVKHFQEEKLSSLLTYVNTHSKFYQSRFKKNNIDVSTINTLNDLQKIPVTTKDDLYNNNNDFICVTPDKIIDYVTTSGTLGDPLTFVLTDKDLERLAYNEHMSLACAGGTKNDIYQ